MLNNVKFLKGTAQSFGAIEVKDANTFYYIDDKDLYLGSIKLSNGEDLAAAILRVAANETAIGNISKDYLKASDKTNTSLLSLLIKFPPDIFILFTLVFVPLPRYS